MVHIPLLLFFQNGLNFLRPFALQEKKNFDDSSRLDVVETVHVAGRASFQPL
jgi:hypothetical protein